jgi:phospholipid-binding lipoprotein MlaA
MKRPLAALLVALPLLAAAAEPLSGATTQSEQGASEAEGVAPDSVPEETQARASNPVDPFERWNRAVFTFNDRIDRAVLRPVARGYRKVVPEPVRRGVGNFFGNVGDAWSAINHFLQGKAEPGLEMTMRFATNSVFGLAGLLDVASEAGLERQEEDFGQTLGRWGLRAGPYLVVPLLGPSSVRDAAALPVDLRASPSFAVGDDATTAALFTLRVIDTRARLLDATRLLDELAFDPYSFTRDAYLARRRSLVYDGNPPEDDGAEDDDAEDDDPDDGDDDAADGEPVSPSVR